MRAGLIGEYFNGYTFNTRVLSLAVPNIAFSWNDAPLPGVSGRFSIVWSGFIRTNVTDTYNFDCIISRGECYMYINGTKITSRTQPVFLPANTNVRIKVTYQKWSWETAVNLVWKHENQTNNEFGVVPSFRLLHQVTCSQGCVHGCCVEEDTCQCNPGESDVLDV